MTQQPFPLSHQLSCQSRLCHKAVPLQSSEQCSASSFILLQVSFCPLRTNPFPFFFFFFFFLKGEVILRDSERAVWVISTAALAKYAQPNQTGLTTHYWGLNYICHAHIPTQTEESLLFPPIMPCRPALNHNYEKKTPFLGLDCYLAYSCLEKKHWLLLFILFSLLLPVLNDLVLFPPLRKSTSQDD